MGQTILCPHFLSVLFSPFFSVVYLKLESRPQIKQTWLSNLWRTPSHLQMWTITCCCLILPFLYQAPSTKEPTAITAASDTLGQDCFLYLCRLQTCGLILNVNEARSKSFLGKRSQTLRLKSAACCLRDDFIT